MSIPKYLYHAVRTNKEVVDIVTKGKENLTSFCTELDHTLIFMKMYHGYGTYNVIKIDTDKLDKSKLFLSSDHDPKFFSSDMTVYVYENLPSGTMTDVYTVTIDEKEHNND